MAKAEKTVKCTGQKKSEKPPSLLTKTEKQRLNSRKPANRGRPQNRKTAVFKCENRNTERNIGQIRKTENPNAPSKNREVYTSETSCRFEILLPLFRSVRDTKRRSKILHWQYCNFIWDLNHHQLTPKMLRFSLAKALMSSHKGF